MLLVAHRGDARAAYREAIVKESPEICRLLARLPPEIIAAFAEREKE